MNDYYAHPTAVIDDGCSIGSGTRVWHFCHIMQGCTIGSNCVIGQNVMIAPGVVLGNNVKVQNNVSLYTGIFCEDDVFLGPSCVFTNVKNPRSAIDRKKSFMHTIVRKGATIGANATIICGNELGEHAFIGAGTVVTRPVPAYGLVTGNPARQIGWMSAAGFRLMFNEEGKAFCGENNDEYRLNGHEVTRVAKEL